MKKMGLRLKHGTAQKMQAILWQPQKLGRIPQNKTRSTAKQKLPQKPWFCRKGLILDRKVVLEHLCFHIWLVRVLLLTNLYLDLWSRGFLVSSVYLKYDAHVCRWLSLEEIQPQLWVMDPILMFWKKTEDLNLMPKKVSAIQK